MQTLFFGKKSFTVGTYIQTGNNVLHMGGLGIRKASEVAVPAYLSSVCATSTGVEAMTSNTIFGENNPFVEAANQRWLAKKNGIYHYEKQDTTDKERALLFPASKKYSDWLQCTSA